MGTSSKQRLSLATSILMFSMLTPVQAGRVIAPTDRGDPARGIVSGPTNDPVKSNLQDA